MLVRLMGSIVALATIAICSTATAGGLDDANAGLSALQSGDNDTAITLFDRAIASGALESNQLELAYFSRGRAYLAKKDYWAAVSDLDNARRLDPGDKDAQATLLSAIAAIQPADLVPEQSASRIWNKIGKSLLNAAAAGIAEGLSQQPQ